MTAGIVVDVEGGFAVVGREETPQIDRRCELDRWRVST
jgi:hypothetical protein